MRWKERKTMKDSYRRGKKGWTEDMGNVRKKEKDTGRREGALIPSFPHCPSLTGTLSTTMGPLSTAGKGIIGQRKQGGELPLFQIRHRDTTLSIPRQGGQVEERRRAVKRRTGRDKHSGRMEIEPTMKWRLRNVELRQEGGGHRKREFIFGNWKVAPRQTILPQ